MNPDDHRLLSPLPRPLWEQGAGFPALALADLLSGSPVRGGKKAKSCIFLFMFGGPSQVDLFDYKPELQKDRKSVV